MELKNKIKKILDENSINPENIIDLGCKDMPYSDLFPNSKILGFDKIKTIILHNKIKNNPKISFFFKNFNVNQNIPNADLVIASLFLHFIKEDSRKKLFQQIKKSKYLLVVHLDKKVDLPREFQLLSKEEFDTEKEKHGGLPEHSHHIILELYNLQ